MMKVSSIVTKKMARKTGMRRQVAGHFSRSAESGARRGSPGGVVELGGATHLQPRNTCGGGSGGGG